MKSDDILDMIGDASGTHVWDAQQVRTGKILSRKASIKRIWLIAAIIATLLALGGGTVWAFSGEGFFKDLFSWNGAITGTSYENATDEMIINAFASEAELSISIQFANPLTEPYSFMETLKIKSFDIIDENGSTILKKQESGLGEINAGAVEIDIPDLKLSCGNYSIVITALEAGKKAEQPLTIHGTWTCHFTIR